MEKIQDSDTKIFFMKPESLSERLAKMSSKELLERETEIRSRRNFEEWSSLAAELKLWYLFALHTGQKKQFNKCLMDLKKYITENKKRWKIQGFLNYLTT